MGWILILKWGSTALVLSAAVGLIIGQFLRDREEERRQEMRDAAWRRLTDAERK